MLARLRDTSHLKRWDHPFSRVAPRRGIAKVWTFSISETTSLQAEPPIAAAYASAL